jgi:hypothetical protein
MSNQTTAAFRENLSSTGFESPALWRAALNAMSEMEALVWGDPLVKDELTRAEGLRYLMRLIGAALPLTIEAPSVEHPQFLNFINPRAHFGLPAPDCFYLWAPIHGDHVYRIVGDKGSAHLFDMEIRNDHIAHIADWQLLDRRSDFEVGPDGQIEIYLSREERDGNWLKLPEGDCNLVFRQYFYDWTNERPANVRIECVGASLPPAPLSAADIHRRTEMFIDWFRNAPQQFAQVARSYYDAPKDALYFDAISFGWKDLQYGKGIYECEVDEAVILEFTPPDAYYWSLQLSNHFWEARDYQLRQTSLNGHQAVLDDDGILRIVIAHKDPGVANWLDAGGHTQGLVAVRYYLADTQPVPTLKRIPFSQLKSTLPTTTKQIDLDTRQQILKDRYSAVMNRNWV